MSSGGVRIGCGYCASARLKTVTAPVHVRTSAFGVCKHGPTSSKKRRPVSGVLGLAPANERHPPTSPTVMASTTPPPVFQFQTLRQHLGRHGDIARDALRIDSSRRTQGVVVRPEHRLAPTTIRPWTDFEQEQAVLWDAVVEATADIRFPHYEHVFETELPHIDCEAAVERCDRLLIHNPAHRILTSIGQDRRVNSALSRTLDSRNFELGHYFFSTHRNQLDECATHFPCILLAD